MKTIWYGHASLGIEHSNGSRIARDCRDRAEAGFNPFPEPAAIAIHSRESNEPSDHDDPVPRCDGAREVDPREDARAGRHSTAHGMELFAKEDVEQIAHLLRDPNRNGMYRLAVDGTVIGRSGDTGNIFSDTQRSILVGIDFVFGRGEGFRITSPEEPGRAAKAAAPAPTIPIHVRSPGYTSRDRIHVCEARKHCPEDRARSACRNSEAFLNDDLPDARKAGVLTHV